MRKAPLESRMCECVFDFKWSFLDLICCRIEAEREKVRVKRRSVLGMDIYRDAIFPFGLLFARNDSISKHLVISLIKTSI